MTEKEFALELTTNAIQLQGKQQKPTMMIDKIEYKKYDFNKLKYEINSLGFEMCNLEDAPIPYNVFPLKNKVLIYKN